MDINISLHIDLDLVWGVVSIVVSALLVAAVGYLLYVMDEERNYEQGSFYWPGLITAWVPVGFWLLFTLFPPDFWPQIGRIGVIRLLFLRPDVQVNMPQIWFQFDWRIIVPVALLINLIVPFLLYALGSELWRLVNRLDHEPAEGFLLVIVAVYCLVFAWTIGDIQPWRLATTGVGILSAVAAIVLCFFGLPRWRLPKRR